MFHKSDGQQRPPFFKGKSSSCCPRKVSSPAWRSAQSLVPCVWSHGIAHRRQKTTNRIYYLSVHVLQKLAFYAVGSTGPVVLPWCVWNCLVADLQEFTLGFSRTLSMHVWILLAFSSVARLLWDPFPPELLTVLCAQWCSLSIIFCRITEDSAVTTFEALKARVRELERQLSRGDRYKCLICMVSSTPLVVMNQKCPGVFALSLLRRKVFFLSPFSGEGRSHPHPCTLWRISFLLSVSAWLF